MKFIQVPAGFSLELFASEPDIVKPISFTFDERGRLWVIEAIELPERRAQRRARRRPDQDRRGHRRRRQGGQVHGLRRSAEPRDEPDVRQRRRDRVGGAAHAVSERHGRRRQGGRPADPQHRMGDSRYARGSLEPSVRPRQLHLGLRRLLRVRRRDEREEAPVHAGHVPVQAGRQRLRVRDDVDEQYVGTGLYRELRRLRFDGEQRSQLPRRDSEQVLRGRRGPAAGARQRTGLSECGAVLHRALHHSVHPPGGRVRGLHGGQRTLFLHRALLSEGVPGTASPSSPNQPRTSSVRESSSRTAPAS